MTPGLLQILKNKINKQKEINDNNKNNNLEEYTKKSKERIITATGNSNIKKRLNKQ